MKKLIAVFIIACIVSCNSNKVPNGILPPDKMKIVLWDYMRADAFTNEFIVKNPNKNLAEENVKLQKEIFAEHHITKKDFYDSYDYYIKNPELMKAIMDSMIAQKTRDSASIFNKDKLYYEQSDKHRR